MNHFFRRFCTAAAMVVSSLLTSPQAVAKELTMASPIPPSHRFTPAFFTAFADKLKEVSGGKLTVKVFTGGALNPSMPKQYSMLLDGVADIAFVIPIYTADVFPTTNTVSVPGVCGDAVGCTRSLWRAYSLIEKEIDAKVLAMWANDTPALITKSRPIRQLADMRGTKVRISGPGEAPYWRAMGAAPVSQEATEINQNLANGMIDGIAVDPASILSFKLHEVGKFVTLGIPAQGIAFTLLMNKKSYGALSPQERQWVDSVAGEAFSVEGARRAAAEDKLAIETSRKSGLEIIQLPEEESRRMANAMAPEVEKFRAQKFRTGVTGAQAYDLMRGK